MAQIIAVMIVCLLVTGFIFNLTENNLLAFGVSSLFTYGICSIFNNTEEEI
jgi:hypothetical protein